MTISVAAVFPQEYQLSRSVNAALGGCGYAFLMSCATTNESTAKCVRRDACESPEV